MALRVTFQEVIQSVRKEARLSTNSSRGIDNLEMIQQKIIRAYTTLCESYDWQHLELKRGDSESRVLLQAGSRYYNWPAAANPLKITGAVVRWGSRWHDLEYGVGPKEYSIYDPEADQRADPVTKWNFHGGDQFEVWPLPATDGVSGSINEIAFEGQRTPEALVSPTSRLDMDDMLVYLMVAAEILAGNGQKDAASVTGGLANQRLEVLRGGLSSKRRVVIGHGTIAGSSSAYPRHPTYIRSR